jgi:hypothetical protein
MSRYHPLLMIVADGDKLRRSLVGAVSESGAQDWVSQASDGVDKLLFRVGDQDMLAADEGLTNTADVSGHNRQTAGGSFE